MKNDVSIIHLSDKIRGFAPDFGGVFSFADLWHLIGLQSSDRVSKIVKRLIKEGLLYKIRRDTYIVKGKEDPDLWVLASRLKKDGYVSMDSVLSQNGLIGTVPIRSVSFIYSGNTQKIETPFGQIRYFKSKKDRFFGTNTIKNGVVVADNEKAYLDMLYYHVRGARFVADPLQDVDLWKLDSSKIKKYLLFYKNQKFRKFVEGIIHETDRRTSGKNLKPSRRKV